LRFFSGDLRQARPSYAVILNEVKDLSLAGTITLTLIELGVQNFDF